MKSAASGPYRICDRCVMDTTDPEITFDAAGVCSHCHSYDKDHSKYCAEGARGEELLQKAAEEIRVQGKGREYDSLLGLSGGVDSSYVAYLAGKLNLRPLVLHVDGGWNSEIAQKNIENIVKRLGFDLFTVVIDWEEMRDLQAAFLRSGLANQDAPQDHAIFAVLSRFAVKHRIRTILSGSNYATESCLPRAWGYNAMDSRLLKSVHARYGRRKLKSFPTVNLFRYLFVDPYVRRVKTIRPLNWIRYDKSEAMKVLEKELGWRYYGGKHYESRFTKFFQAHYLPEKFGYDKRRPHLSSLVVSGQMTRDQALEELKHELYPAAELREDREFVLKKLGISDEEFDLILRSPNRTYRNYPSDAKLLEFMNRVRAWLVRRGVL
ncbi:MAG: N-acetyl sugar amidotransferase [Candidatus Omnitrophica bacterium]|nr:N-acetyl sugar amidotransferase [Candidatus Omnitrophota bacterium]